MKKRCLSILLVLCMAVTLLPISTIAVEPTSGRCGDNLTWTLENGVLTISGTGPMNNFSYGTDTESIAPWHGGGAPADKWVPHPEWNIKKIVIEDGVTSIGNCAFYGCVNMTEISIPKSVTTIGRRAFESCRSLASFDFPEGVATLEDRLFAQCFGLKSIKIPSTVTNIATGPFEAFTGCKNLTNIDVDPNNANYCSIDGVLYTKDLTTLLRCPEGKTGEFRIQDGVTTIPYYAFFDCVNLTDILIPSSVNNISTEKNPFTYRSGMDMYYNLQNFIVDEQNEVYSSNNGVLMDKQQTVIYAYPSGRSDSYVIPKSVTKLASYSFNSSKLTNIDFSNSITEIGNYAFAYCHELTEVIIPNSVERMGASVFDYCDKLTSIYVPDSIVTIYDTTFSNCYNLKDLYYKGSEEQWKKLFPGGLHYYFPATIHYNSTSPDDVGPVDPDVPGDTASVYFLSNWDAITQTIGFGDPALVSPYTYTFADDVDTSNLSKLVGKYVLVTMEQGDSSLEYAITDIQPVESKIGTVSATGEHSLTIDGITYPVREDYILGVHNGQEFLYHISNGTIMGFDVLEEKHGVLGSWNDTTRKITIGGTEYPTNYLSDLSFMDSIRDYFQKDVTFLVADSSSYCPMIKVIGLHSPSSDVSGFNVDVYHANWLSQDTTSSTVLNLKTPSQILSDQVSGTMEPTVTLWQSFTGLFDALDDVSTLKDLALEKKDMYTAIILTALEASYSVDALPIEFSKYEDYISLSNSFVNSVSNTMKVAYGYDIAAPGNLKNMTSKQQDALQEVVNDWFKKNFPQLSDISEVLNGVKNGFKIVGDVEDLYEYVVSAIMLNTMSEDLKVVVRKANELSKTSGNVDLALALADCASIIDLSAEQLEEKIATTAAVSLGLDFLLDELQEEIQSVLLEVRPEAYILVKIYKIGRDITDKLFNTDSIIEKYLKMMATLDVEELGGRTYEELQREFLNSKNTYAAKAYLRGMDMMYDLRKMDCASAYNYVEEIDEALVNKILQAFGKQNYDELKTSIQNIQDSYKVDHVGAASGWIWYLDEDYPGTGLYEKYEHLYDIIRDTILKKEVKVACPVNVYVYDQSNNLAAVVTDEQISCSVDDITVALLDSQKVIRMYNDANYRIEYVGYDVGNMDITITEFNENKNIIRTVNYYNIPLTNGKAYIMDADDEPLHPYNLVEKINNSVIEHNYDSMDTSNAHSIKIISGTLQQNNELFTETMASKGETLQLNAYVPESYEFVRWESSSANALIADINSVSTTLIMPDEDLSVTAIMRGTHSPSTVYTVKFDPNGGTLSGPATLTTSTTGKLSSLPTPTRNGCTFDGWYTAASGGEQITTDHVFSSDTTIFAHWRKNSTSITYTITFDAGSGTVTPSTATTGGDGKLSTLPVPTRTGYTFDGWYTAVSGGDKITTDYTFTSDTIVYAHWTKNSASIVYTITFDAGGGAVTPSSTSTGDGGKLSILPTPTRHGYTFGGWYTAVFGGEKINTNYIFTSDTTVYAHWTKNSGGSSGDSSSSSGGSSSGGNSSTSNSITAGNSAHGSVSVSPKSASKGTKVTLTVQPDQGYTLDNLVVKDAKGNSVELIKETDAKYTFTMPGSKVTIDATFSKIEQHPSGKISFTDVSIDAYYYDAVAWAVEQGITFGTSATTFSPDAPSTRAQIVTFLWRAAGSPVMDGDNLFTDVAPGSYYYDAVQWAVARGITVGTSADTFSPDAICTRGQAMTFLYRYEKSPVVHGNNSFADVSDNAYYTNAVQWAVLKGVTAGTSTTTFSPEATCTRSQIVTFLYRDMA